jgi:hypothetical protein
MFKWGGGNFPTKYEEKTPCCKKKQTNFLVNLFMLILKAFAFLFYYIFYFGATYFFFDFAQKYYTHIWIVTNILIGLFGATMFVYPLKIVKFGTYGVIIRYIFYLWLLFILYGTSLLISELLGFGTVHIH